MDFFQNQEVARKKTGRLIVYFLLAVILIIVTIYLAIAAVLHWAEPAAREGGSLELPSLWDPQLFVVIAAGTAALISGGSLYKIASLSGGGHTVAELMGGRLLHPQTRDLDERKILNVVEEMAIAAGTPVPPVYLLENEEGINAFAAGHSPNDAVIGVTRGCVRALSRRIARRDRARIQSHFERRHEAQPSTDGGALRHLVDRAFRVHSLAKHDRLQGAGKRP